MNSSLLKGLGVLALLVALALALPGCDPTPDMVSITITSTAGGYVEEKDGDDWKTDDVETERSVIRGAPITLRAVAEANYEFDGWEITGAEYGDEEQLEKEEITVTDFEENAEIKATFAEKVIEPEEYTLSIDKDGEGTVKVDDDAVDLPFSKEYEEGTDVDLEAEPAEYWVFKEWTGDVTDTDAQITVTMDEDLDITAVFEEIPKYEVTFSDPDNGTLTAEVDGDAISSGDEVYEGKDVEFKATPDEGYRVDKWIVNGEPVDGESGQTYTYESLDEDIEVEVELTEVIYWYEVTFTQPDNGTLTAEVDGTAISSGDEVEEGRDVVFTVDPDDDYYVQAWELNEEEVDEETELTYTYTDLDKDIDVAVILFEAYAVTFSDPDNGELKAEVDDEEIESGDLVEEGKDVLFTVDPDERYEVEEWLVNDEVQEDETELTYTYSDLAEEIDVQVNLKLIKYDVTFEVTDEDGDPIEGATVDLEGEEETTDADGEAVFNVPIGEYDYTVSKEEYEDKTGKVEVVDEDITEEVTLELIRYDVTFAVIDEDGNPIAGATVDLEDEQKTTDADGQAVFAVVPGEHDYTVSKDDYGDETGEVVVVDKNVVKVVTLKSIKYDVTFTVVDEDEQPLVGATVDLEGEVKTTDTDGQAVFAVPSGEHAYTVSKDDYEEKEGTVVVDDADVDVEVTLTKLVKYDVTFTVVDEDEEPIEGATVGFAGEEQETDAAGIAVFNVVAGEYVYNVSKEGYKTILKQVEVVDADVDVEVTLEESEIVVSGITDEVLDETEGQYLEFEVSINETPVPVDELEDEGYTYRFSSTKDVLADDDDPTVAAKTNKDGLVFYEGSLLGQGIEDFRYQVIIEENGEEVARSPLKLVKVLDPTDWMEVTDATLVKEFNGDDWVVHDVLVPNPGFPGEEAELRPNSAIQRDGEIIEPDNDADYLDDWANQVESVDYPADYVEVNVRDNGNRVEVEALQPNDNITITVTLISGETFVFNMAVKSDPRKIDRIEVAPDPVEITSTDTSAPVEITVFDQYDTSLPGANIILVSGVDDDDDTLFDFNPATAEETNNKGQVEFTVNEDNVEDTDLYEIWVYDADGVVPDPVDRENEKDDKIGKFEVDYIAVGVIENYELRIHRDSPVEKFEDWKIDAYLDGAGDRDEKNSIIFKFVAVDEDGNIVERATADKVISQDPVNGTVEIAVDDFTGEVFTIVFEGDIDAVDIDAKVAGTDTETDIITLTALKGKTGTVIIKETQDEDVVWDDYEVEVEYSIPELLDLELPADVEEFNIAMDGGEEEIAEGDLKEWIKVIMDEDDVDFDFSFSEMDDGFGIFKIEVEAATGDDHLLGYLTLSSSDKDVFTVDENVAGNGVKLETVAGTTPEDEANIRFQLRDTERSLIDGSLQRLWIKDRSGADLEMEEDPIGMKTTAQVNITNVTDEYGDVIDGAAVNVTITSDQPDDDEVFTGPVDFSDPAGEAEITTDALNTEGLHTLTVTIDGLTVPEEVTVDVQDWSGMDLEMEEDPIAEGYTATVNITNATDVSGDAIDATNVAVTITSNRIADGEVFNADVDFTDGEAQIETTDALTTIGTHELTVDIDGVTEDGIVEVEVVEDESGFELEMDKDPIATGFTARVIITEAKDVFGDLIDGEEVAVTIESDFDGVVFNADVDFSGSPGEVTITTTAPLTEIGTHELTVSIEGITEDGTVSVEVEDDLSGFDLDVEEEFIFSGDTATVEITNATDVSGDDIQGDRGVTIFSFFGGTNELVFSGDVNFVDGEATVITNPLTDVDTHNLRVFIQGVTDSEEVTVEVNDSEATVTPDPISITVNEALDLNVTDARDADGDDLVGTDVEVTVSSSLDNDLDLVAPDVNFTNGTATIQISAGELSTIGEHTLTVTIAGVLDERVNVTDIVTVVPGAPDTVNVAGIEDQIAGEEFNIAGNISDLEDEFGNTVADGDYSVTVESDVEDDGTSETVFGPTDVDFVDGAPVDPILITLEYAADHSLTVEIGDATASDDITVEPAEESNVTVEDIVEDQTAGEPFNIRDRFSDLEDEFGNTVADGDYQVIVTSDQAEDLEVFNSNIAFGDGAPVADIEITLTKAAVHVLTVEVGNASDTATVTVVPEANSVESLTGKDNVTLAGAEEYTATIDEEVAVPVTFDLGGNFTEEDIEDVDGDAGNVVDLLAGTYTVNTDAEGDLNQASITINWADDRSEVTDNLEASIDEGDANVGTSDSETLEITLNTVTPAANFEVTIVEGDSTLEVILGDDFEIRVDVENTGDAEGTQTITASVDTDEVVTKEVEDLGAGDTDEITLTFEAEADHDGEEVTVASEDDTATTTLTVIIIDPAGSSVDAESDPNNPNQNEQFAFDVTVVDTNANPITGLEEANFHFQAELTGEDRDDDNATGTLNITAVDEDGDTGVYTVTANYTKNEEIDIFVEVFGVWLEDVVTVDVQEE